MEKRILNGLKSDNDGQIPNPYISIENDRIKKVLGKYAFAHFCFERGEHPEKEAIQINFAFINQLTEEQIKLFNKVESSGIFPEVGSRLFQRVIENGDSWMVTQNEHYRYYISKNQPYVKIVISEFLFAEVVF